MNRNEHDRDGCRDFSAAFAVKSPASLHEPDDLDRSAVQPERASPGSSTQDACLEAR